MKSLRKIIKKVGSTTETLVWFEDMGSTESQCVRRNILPISIICEEANPLDCLYYRRGTSECGYRMSPEVYKDVPVELIRDLRKNA